MEPGIRVLGMAEVINNLRQLSKRLQSNILRRASRAAGQVYLKDVKSQTYGGGRQQITGLLQRSSAVTVSKKQDTILGRVKMRPINISARTKVAKAVRKQRRIKTGDVARNYTAFYWRFLEFGVTGRKTKSGANRGSLSARPWVTPIFNADAGPAIDAYRDAVEKGLTEEALKLPKTYRK